MRVFQNFLSLLFVILKPKAQGSHLLKIDEKGDFLPAAEWHSSEAPSHPEDFSPNGLQKTAE